MKEPLKITREFIEHLLVPEIRLNYKNGKLNLIGFHHDWNNRLHNAGFLKQCFTKNAANEAYHISLYLGDVNIKGINNFFPSNWNHVELFDNINQQEEH